MILLLQRDLPVDNGWVYLEIRTYRLKPGMLTEFVRLMGEEAVPLMAKQGITVVDYGASAVDDDGHEYAYLTRAFASLAERESQEEAFYAGDVWRHGPREAVIACIASYHTVVFEAADLLNGPFKR